jgi:hypothetical protein
VVRSWIRQALRASGVAILVPAAVVAAIALSVVGGGGSVGSLGEVLDGPAVPPAEAATRAPQPRRDERPRARRRGLSPQSGSGLRGLSPQSGSGLRGLSPQSGRPVTTVPLRPRRPQAPQPARSPQPSPPAATPSPAPHPVHDAGTQVAQAVRPLPVAGPVAAGAVQAVVDLVDSPA